MTILAVIFTAINFWTSGSCGFVRCPDYLSFTVHPEYTFGSEGRTNGTLRLTRDLYNALVEIPDAYYERAVYSSSGPSNDWPVAIFGPRPSVDVHDIMVTNNWHGSFSYSTWDDSDGYLYAPSSLRLIDVENIYGLCKKGIIDFTEGIGNDGIMLRRGLWWEPDGPRRIWWASSVFDNLSDEVPITHGFVECETSSGIDLSHAFLPMRVLHPRSKNDFRRTEFAQFSAATNVIQYMWIDGILPLLETTQATYFEDSLSAYTSLIPGIAYLYPGESGYLGYTRRLTPDEYSAQSDGESESHYEVSPIAAASRVLCLADKTFEVFHQKDSGKRETEIVKATRTGDEFSTHMSSVVKFELGISFNPLGEIIGTLVADDFTPLAFGYIEKTREGFSSVKNEVATNDFERVRYRFDGFEYEQGDTYAYVENFGEISVSFNVDQEFILSAIRFSGGFPTNHEGVVPFSLLPPYNRPFSTIFNLDMHSWISGKSEPYYTFELLDRIHSITDLTYDVDFEFGLYGLKKSARFEYTKEKASPEFLESVMTYAGPSDMAFKMSKVGECNLFSLFNLVALYSIDPMKSGPYSFSTKVEDVHLFDTDSSPIAIRIPFVGDFYKEVLSQKTKMSVLSGMYDSVYEAVYEKGNHFAQTSPENIADDIEVKDYEIDWSNRSISHLGIDAGMSVSADVGDYFVVLHDGVPIYLFKGTSITNCVLVTSIKCVISLGFAPQVVHELEGYFPNFPDGDKLRDLMMAHPPVAVDAKGAGLYNTKWKWSALAPK